MKSVIYASCARMPGTGIGTLRFDSTSARVEVIARDQQDPTKIISFWLTEDDVRRLRKDSDDGFTLKDEVSSYYLVRAKFPGVESLAAFTNDGSVVPAEEVLVNGNTEADRISANNILQAYPKAWFKSVTPHDVWARGAELFATGLFFKPSV